MYTPMNPILAADADIPAKAIYWVIVLIVWGVGSLVSAMKKATRGQAPPPRVPLVPPLAGKGVQALPTVPPPTPGSAMAEVLWAQMQKMQMPDPTKRKKSRRTPPPLVPPPRVPSPPARPSLSQTAPEMAPVVSATFRPPQITAAALQPMLQADSLRTQWILLEVLGKPLALREE